MPVIQNSDYGASYRERVKIDFDPSAHETTVKAAKAFYEAMKPVVKAHGLKPEIELILREVDCGWRVSWESGPYEWGIVASNWLLNSDAGWYTEPYHSFDVTFVT